MHLYVCGIGFIREADENSMLRRCIKLLILFLLIEPSWALDQSFNMGLRLFQPITVTKNKDIVFPTNILTGTDSTIVVNTSDTGAAVFDASGGKNRTLARYVVESTITLAAPGVPVPITVDAISVSGPTAFDSGGEASNFKIGATANILASSEDGDYVGVGTLGLYTSNACA